MTTQIQIGAIATSAVQSIQGPRITSVYVTDSSYNNLDDTAVDSVAGGYIKIIGTGFASGCIVVVGGLTATSTTFVSSTEVRAQIQAQAAGSYTLYLSNSDGSLAIKAIGITFSGFPAWSTSTSQTFNGASISFQFSASSDSTVAYSLNAGSSLPPGLSLSSGGLLSGTFTGTSGTVYTFILQATDSENQNSPRTFSITISLSDPYFYLTTFATHADGPTILTDASTNNFELTVSGTPRANNNTPFGTGWSNYFGGSDYLTLADSASYTFGTGNFTIECWFNTSSSTQSYGKRLINHYIYTGGTDYGWLLALQRTDGSYTVNFYGATSGSIGVNISTTTAITARTWHHVAVSRSGSVVSLFLDGTRVATTSGVTWNDTNTISSGLGIGVQPDNTTGTTYDGYISNVRIVKGTAVYDPTLTTLTVPTSPLTAIVNTQLLICQSNRFVDTSTNAFALTVTGSPTVQSFNPFNITNTGTDGSMYFNGSTDYVSVASTSALTLGTSAFTFECWIYPTSWAGSGYGNIIWAGTVTHAPILYYNSSNGYITFRDFNTADIVTMTAPPAGCWTHIAVSRSSNTFYIFKNGVLANSASYSISFVQSAVCLGWDAVDAGYYFTGYISNARIVIGSTLYTSTFTPSTSALTAVSNTSLLTLQNKASHNTTTGHQDTSSNQLLVTTTGTPASGTFSPFSQTGWSYYNNGTASTYVTVPYTTANFDWWTTDYTIDVWIYPLDLTNWSKNTVGSYIPNVVGNMDPSTAAITNYWSFGIDDSGHARLYYYNGGYNYVTSTATVNLNQWNHIGMVKTSSGVSVLVNGVATSPTAVSGTPQSTATVLSIGSYNGTAVNGYISNLRIVKGTAVYSGTTYTVPTTPLTAISNTKLLTMQSNRFVDNSTNALAHTITLSPSIQSFSPFAPSNVYSQSANGGSVYFGGTSDWITAPMNTAITGDFTAECWFYCTASAAAYNGIFAKRTSGATYSPFLLGLSAGGSGTTIALLLSTSGSSWAINTTFSAVTFNQWNHIALVRNGSAINCYLNGTSVYSGTLSGTLYNPTDAFSVGALGANGYGPFNGYISNARLVIGTAVYTSAFTPPTAPVTSTTNTVLLAANGTGTALTDVSSRSNMITTGIAKISTATKKYGTGSMYFNGSTDYFTTNPGPMSVIGSGDFTIEHWVNFTSTTAYINTISDNTYFTTTGNWIFMWNYAATGYLTFWINNAAVCSTSAAYNDGNWHHVAVTRSGSTVTIWVDGVSRGTGTSSASIGNTSGIIIGNQSGMSRYFTGYIDDVRITRYARYTANFTPMTSTFKDQ